MRVSKLVPIGIFIFAITGSAILYSYPGPEHDADPGLEKSALLPLILPPIRIPDSAMNRKKSDSLSSPISKIPQKTNIVLIYTDDQSFSEVGYYNNNVLTPNIDILFRDGIRFPNARVTTSLCTPSRYGLHTGLRASSALVDIPPRNEVKEVAFQMRLTEKSLSLGKVLRDAGYQTGFVGKWHLGRKKKIESGVKSRPLPQQALEHQHRQDVDYIKRHGGFDYVAGVYISNPLRVVKSHKLPRDFLMHNAEWVTSGATNFLRQASKGGFDSPFFLLLAPTLVHNPPVKMDSDLRKTPYGILAQAPTVQPTRESVASRVKEHLGSQSHSALDMRRLRSITLLDDGIGVILEELKNQKLMDNTLIIFMSDNSDGKGSIYDDGVRVPTAVYWPGTAAARTSSALISNIDIFPTLVELAYGAAVGIQVHGESFLDILLSGRDAKMLKPVILELGFARSIVTSDGWQYVALRFPKDIAQRAFSGQKVGHQGRIGKPRWPVHWSHPGYFSKDQLYNLSTDPRAVRSLAEDPLHADRLKMMQKLLKDALRSTEPAYAERL